MKSAPSTSNRNARFAFLALALALVVFAVFRLMQAPPELSMSFDSFSGTVQFTARDRSISSGTRTFLDQRIPALMQELELALSDRNPKSKLAEFNTSTNTTPFDAGPRLWRLVDLYARLAADTTGTVDVGQAEVHTLWQRVAAGARPPPDEIEVKRLLVAGGTERMIIPASPFFRRTEGGVKLQLGELADGYVADTLAACLEENGIKNYELSVRGATVSRTTGTRSTLVKPGETLGFGGAASIRLKNAVVHTLPGPVTKQVIDYRTGRPSTNRVLAVSVVADEGVAACGLAAVLRVLGPDEGRAWLEKQALAKRQNAKAAWFLRAADGGVETVSTAGFPLETP